MRRTPMPKTQRPLKRTELRRTGKVRPRRPTPRRRVAPKWSTEEWETGNQLLMARSGGCCELCGAPLLGRAERAHRVRRRDGGDRLTNLLLLHPQCHAWTHANPAAAGELGLILQTFEDPAAVPVWHRATSWVLLDDNGHTTPTEAPAREETA